MTKLFKYRTAGVLEYWIVDPDKNRVTVYDFRQDTMDEYTFTDDIAVGLYPVFSFAIFLCWSFDISTELFVTRFSA